MNRVFIAMVLLSVATAAVSGQPVVLDDLKARGAVQLSKQDLQQLLPGAKVVSHFEGSRRSWKNKADGTLLAISDVRRDPSKLGKQSTGQGSWRVDDNGRWCVTIEWPKRTENWCKYLFKADAQYYGVKSVTNGGAEAWEFEISQ